MSQRGLTLVEMLISLSIFSVITASCVVVLRLGIDSDAQLQRSFDETQQLQIMRTLMKSDLAQVSARLVRGEDGRVQPGPMAGGTWLRGDYLVTQEGDILLLALTRNGWSNPQATYPRSSLQYVEYLLRDDQLIRRARTHLDAQEESAETTRILLSGLEDVSIRFLSGRDWRQQWLSRSGQVAPPALEITLTHPVYGELVQLFHIAETKS